MLQLHTSLAAVWHAALHALAAAGLAWQLSQHAVPAWLQCEATWHALPAAFGSACWRASKLACPSVPVQCATPSPATHVLHLWFVGGIASVRRDPNYSLGWASGWKGCVCHNNPGCVAYLANTNGK